MQHISPSYLPLEPKYEINGGKVNMQVQVEFLEKESKKIKREETVTNF